MGFYLAARAIVQPGSVVAVEALGYPPAWAAFRSAGAEVVPIRVDASGLVVSELQELAERRRVAAVYVTPHHQYPTMAVLAADRRLALLELSRKHRFAVVEDDYDNEIHYHGRPVLPLASADTAGSVIYVGTLSKVLAPGLRVGYVVAPPPLIERMAELRRSVDRQGDAAMEYAVAELLEDGILQRHARKMRRIYLARRDALVELLHARFSGVLSFEVPAGGLSLWAHVDPSAGVEVDDWQRAALARGVYFRPPAELAFDGRSRPFVRLSFAPLTEEELKTAVERLRVSLSDLRLRGHARDASGAPRSGRRRSRVA
jgi:GntR family transcriptional regulator/MocR family aminotransferase